ncbi:phytanoyl-CoA dioxygenase family protein [Croceimicrobium hydrocarbonivorans]|uniref:Phytanoyl-CoA dioxygenase family protein n=1 Tax=Croceimicrobium hydrocarbonivorans TaxID=2761580 RepID=A0A7H0VD86_9FLAO|nr:phytanoyl-CoA dioxygenase family protein [Croceimicrobium hydrocarbonivorans]QNR23684.1 phytanoyl-CoA dioxygenase family protein [Croceimicrobium hydrocarbonivorans]
MNIINHKKEFEELGSSIIPGVFNASEINAMIDLLEQAKPEPGTLIENENLFAIRQLLIQVPGLSDLIFTPYFSQIFLQLASADYFLSKAIYFDKAGQSNWFVAYHQDLSISVKEKASVTGYRHWTLKKGQYGVEPPLEILENTITIRIHLDNTGAENGALRIIPKSHKKGIHRFRSAEANLKGEQVCEVQKGGIHIMSPLLMHASSRSSSKQARRVIHLEFNSANLAKPLEWLEYLRIDSISPLSI